MQLDVFKFQTRRIENNSRLFLDCSMDYLCVMLSDCQKVFALVVRSTQELKEKLFSFVIVDEEVNKTNYLQTLCRQMAIVIRVADAVRIIC